MSEQPNVLLIMVDQMAHDAIGALGHPAALTPNLDRLVRSGASFSNAYCNSPICVPSRAALMTGGLPRRTGVFDNGSELPASAPTIAHHLTRAGYRTVLAGKMHFVGPDQHHGFAERLSGDVSLPGFTLTPDWSRGAYPNEGSSVSRLTGPNVVDWNLQLAFDEEVLSSTLARLRTLARDRERFFLCASFSNPHDPFEITREYWERYEASDIQQPSAPAVPLDEMHPFDQWIQIHHEVDRHGALLSDEVVRANRRAYLAMVSYVDDHVGRLLAELERLGLEDTLVVFTSDHGEMLGEHGMWFKRTSFDAASKVPMILRRPGRIEAGVRSKTVSLVDLTATLLDLCEVPKREEWLQELDGDSFTGLLGERPQPGWKDSAVCEYFAEGALEPMQFLRKGRYKYVHVNRHEPRLFDLETDPHELHDLAGQPEHDPLLDSMRLELLGDLDMAALRERITRSQRERLMILSTGPERRAWSYRPVRDPLGLYPAAKQRD